jgi:stage II sporulation protein D
MSRRRLLSVPLALLLCLGLTATATATATAASSRLTIRGAGWGHGVGMSQYGAKGFAEHGAGYREILRHYYTGTDIGGVNPGQPVRVLMQPTRTSASFSGATSAGDRGLDPESTYQVRERGGSSVWLLSPSGRRLGSFSSPLVVRSASPITLSGTAGNGRRNGAYRGSFEFRSSLGGVNAINVLALDDYLQGVVPAESPSSWPAEALKAQAVAARSFAVTGSKGGDGFDHYADTRSQVYGGAGVEAASTTDAVRQTAGQVVSYQGNPITAYFFSTSGGRTENVENTALGREPVPWLRSVEDPYEVAPRHRWGPIRMTLAQAQRKLGALVKGRFRGIEVVDRGASPRIVAADVVGTRGRTSVPGATLRARFGLFDTWAFFTSISSRDDDPPKASPTRAAGGGWADGLPSQVSAFAAGRQRGSSPVGTLTGRVTPGRPGSAVVIQRVEGGRWTDAGRTILGAGGRYRHAVDRPGDYRVLSSGAAGPRVRIR